MTRALNIETGVPLVVDLDGTLTLTDTLYESFAKFLFQNPVAAFAVRAASRAGAGGGEALHRGALPPRSRDTAVPGRPYRYRQSRKGARTRGPSRDRRRSGHRGRRRAPSRPVRVSGRERRAAQSERSEQARRTCATSFPTASSTRATAAPTCRYFAARAASSCATSPVRRPPRSRRQKFQCSRRCAGRQVPLKPGCAPSACTNGRRTSCCSCRCSSAMHSAIRRPSLSSALGFALLCLLSSATYIVNDLADLDADRAHATKRLRPFASGSLKIVHGLIAAPLMILAALAGAFALSPPFAGALLAYLILTTAYSFGLKRVALLDVFVIGVLFTLRIVMGAEVAGLAHSAMAALVRAVVLHLARAVQAPRRGDARGERRRRRHRRTRLSRHRLAGHARPSASASASCRSSSCCST